MSYQVIPNIAFILAVLGMILIVARRLPETNGPQSAAEPTDKLAAKGLPVVALSKIRTWLKFRGKKIWNFMLEAKDLRPHSAIGYQMRKGFGGRSPALEKPAAPKPAAADEIRNEQYYLDNIRLQPKNLENYDALGKFYIGQDNFEDAVNTYIYLTGHRPQSADYHARLAFCQYHKKNFQKAAESYKKAIALDSTQPNRYYNLGLSLEQAGQAGDAAKNYEKAAQLEPSAKYFQAAAAAYRKAGDNIKAKDMDSAARNLQAAKS